MTASMDRCDVTGLMDLIHSLEVVRNEEACRQADPDVLEDDECGPVFAKVEADGERSTDRVLQEAEAAGPLCAEVLAASSEMRRKLLVEARFHTIAVVRGLLLQVAGQRTRDRRQAITLAEYTLEICRRVPAAAAEGVLIEEARAQGWCEIATARLDLGERTAAQKALRAAARHLGDNLVTLERGGFARILGRLRAGQGRIDEALALFDRSAALFAELGQREESEAALAEKGCVLFRVTGSLAGAISAPTPRPEPSPAAPR